MRRAARVDANHLDICHVLRQSGQSVFSTAALGNGFPDAVTAFRGINYLMTIPLTREEHTNGHAIGWKTWEKLHGSQLEYVARTLGRAIEEGVITIKGYEP